MRDFSGEGDYLKNPAVDGRVILNWILGKWDGSKDWIDLAQDRDWWWVCCKCSNKPSGSIKCGNFFE
jgi:hypothetical protein